METTHKHGLIVRYHGPGNKTGTRVGITSNRFDSDRVYVSWDYALGDSSEQAAKWLTDHGYTIHSYADMGDHYVVFVNEFVSPKVAAKDVQACNTWREEYGYAKAGA